MQTVVDTGVGKRIWWQPNICLFSRNSQVRSGLCHQCSEKYTEMMVQGRVQFRSWKASEHSCKKQRFLSWCLFSHFRLEWKSLQFAMIPHSVICQCACLSLDISFHFLTKDLHWLFFRQEALFPNFRCWGPWSMNRQNRNVLLPHSQLPEPTGRSEDEDRSANNLRVAFLVKKVSTGRLLSIVSLQIWSCWPLDFKWNHWCEFPVLNANGPSLLHE